MLETQDSYVSFSECQKPHSTSEYYWVVLKSNLRDAFENVDPEYLCHINSKLMADQNKEHKANQVWQFSETSIFGMLKAHFYEDYWPRADRPLLNIDHMAK